MSSRTLSLTGLPPTLGGTALTPVRLRGSEALNTLYLYELDLKTPEHLGLLADPSGANLPLHTLCGQEATASLELDTAGIPQPNHHRHFSGIIERAAYLRPEGRHHLYRLTLRPWLWLATLRTDCKIFQDQNVISILDTVLASYPYPVDKRLSANTYPTRDITLQFNETDFDFFARLCEEWGIAWWFEHAQGQHRLVLADDQGAFTTNPASAYQRIDYFPPNFKTNAEYIHALDYTERLTPGAVASTDWDYTRARADLSVSHHDHRPTQQADFEQYLWPIDSAQPQAGSGGMQAPHNDPVAEGDLLVRRRLQALQQNARIASGEGHLRGMVTGHTFTLNKHPKSEANIDWLILSTELDVEEIPQETQGSASIADVLLPPQQWRCTARFTLQAANTLYRPPRITPKPKAHCHRAIVTGPQEGDQSKEIWTDSLGRIKVAFPWHRNDPHNETSSAWLRVVSPWAGAQYGGIHLPRVGQEVIVDFENGDIDRPIVTGRLVNNTQLPPWALPANQALSGFKSKEIDGHGANHLVMDDTQGHIQAQLSSDAHLSQLSLGHITRIPDESGRQDARGQGFELRTDAHGVVRAKDGLLITTEAKPNATGHVKSMAETTARLNTAQQTHDQLADLAKQHQANEGQHGEVAKALQAQNKAIQGQGAVDAQAGQFPEFDQPHLTLASPAGIQATTSGSIHLAADTHVAITTGQDVSVAASGGLFASVNNGLRAFVYQAGAKLVAAQDNIELIALQDNIRLFAKLDITHTAERIELIAQEQIVINGASSAATWTGSGILFQTNGVHTVHRNGSIETPGKSAPLTPPPITAHLRRMHAQSRSTRTSHGHSLNVKTPSSMPYASTALTRHNPMRRLTAFVHTLIACTAALCLLITTPAHAQDNFGQGSSASTWNYTDWYIGGWSLSFEGPIQEIVLGTGPSAFSRQNDKDKIVGGGGKVECCVTVPKVWPKGSKYIFRWLVNKRNFATDPYIKGQAWWPIWYKAQIELAPYATPPQHGIHAQFLTGDRVKLVANDGTNLRRISQDDAGAAPPEDNDPYIFVGYPDEERNAQLMEQHKNDDWEGMEKSRRSDVVARHVRTTQGDHAAKIFSLFSLIERREWLLRTHQYDTLTYKSLAEGVPDFKEELRELEKKYGRTAQQIMNAQSVEEAYKKLESKK